MAAVSPTVSSLIRVTRSPAFTWLRAQESNLVSLGL